MECLANNCGPSLASVEVQALDIDQAFDNSLDLVEVEADKQEDYEDLHLDSFDRNVLVDVDELMTSPVADELLGQRFVASSYFDVVPCCW